MLIRLSTLWVNTALVKTITPMPNGSLVVSMVGDAGVPVTLMGVDASQMVKFLEAVVGE